MPTEPTEPKATPTDPPVPSSSGPTKPWSQDLVDRCADLLQTHPDAAFAREYLHVRGLSLETAAVHHVGVTGPVAAGTAPFLAWARRHWSVWGGLVFPLYDPMGQLVGLEVRRLPHELQPGQGAYSDFQFARVGGTPFAFGLHASLPEIWRTERVVLVEGIFDYFGVYEAGARNAVANLTANVGGPMRRFLGRYAKVVIALLDMDGAGRVAAATLQQIGVEEGFLVTTLAYPGKDPGTLLQNRQLAPLQNLLKLSL